MKRGKRYTGAEKLAIWLAAQATESREHMETVVAPALAEVLDRTVCGICKQIELARGFYYRHEF